MISEGRVLVDGRVARLGEKVDPSRVRILVDGLPLPVVPDLVHYLVYKPTGVVSTASDPQGRPTVVDLVPPGTRVYPVGRLDADSEGLIILTNDGALTDLVTHPRYEVTKTYVVAVDGTPSKAALRTLQDGVQLDDGEARAVTVRMVAEHGDASLVEVVMKEGRKREVRRMLDAVGHPVRRLVRTAIGPVRDRSLDPGTWRPLTIQEIRSLYAAAGVAWDDDAAAQPGPGSPS